MSFTCTRAEVRVLSDIQYFSYNRAYRRNTLFIVQTDRSLFAPWSANIPCTRGRSFRINTREHLKTVKGVRWCIADIAFPGRTVDDLQQAGLRTVGMPDVALTCKSWQKLLVVPARTATFQERSLHQVCAQTRATLVYYLPMLHGHAPHASHFSCSSEVDIEALDFTTGGSGSRGFRG